MNEKGTVVVTDMPSFLLKYLPFESGVETLSTGKLQWKNPNTSVDPYSINANMPLSFEQEHLQAALVKSLLHMLFAPDDPSGAPSHPIHRAVMRWRSQSRFSCEEEALSSLQEITRAMVSTHFERIREYHQKWVEVVSRQRVLDLSESLESLHTWDDWADCHRGIALRLNVGEGRTVVKPHKVRYRSVMTPVTSLQEQLQVLLGEAMFPNDDREDVEERCLGANREYQYRKAWRCFCYVEKPEVEHTSVLTQEEVSAVYIGLRIAPKEQQALKKVIQRMYPSTKIYHPVQSDCEYSIKFRLAKA